MAYTPPGQTREKVYRFMRERLLAGAPPTVREVQEAMGFDAVESARRHLDGLVQEGRLVKTPGLSRSYRIADEGPRPSRVRAVPVIGRVQAGDLHAAIESPDGYITIEGDGRGEMFALRVRGDSMSGAGILPDDVLVVRKQDKAEPGDVVVAMVDGEATVKTFRRRGRKVELVPANPAYKPIELDAEQVQILGRVVELRRNFRAR